MSEGYYSGWSRYNPIADKHEAEAMLGHLHDDGLDLEPYLARGQLIVLTHNDTYTRQGHLDLDGMIALLRAEMEQALATGYSPCGSPVI